MMNEQGNKYFDIVQFFIVPGEFRTDVGKEKIPSFRVASSEDDFEKLINHKKDLIESGGIGKVLDDFMIFLDEMFFGKDKEKKDYTDLVLLIKKIREYLKNRSSKDEIKKGTVSSEPKYFPEAGLKVKKEITIKDALRPDKESLIFRSMYELGIIDKNFNSTLPKRGKQKLLAFVEVIHDDLNITNGSISKSALMKVFQKQIGEKHHNLKEGKNYDEFKRTIMSHLNDPDKPTSWPVK